MRLFHCLLTASLLAGTIALAQDAQSSSSQSTTANPASTQNAPSTAGAVSTKPDLKPAAQQPGTPPPKRVDYAKPTSHFPWIITPYMTRHVPDPVTVNTPRIDQVMHTGKIMLSLDDAIALALENNLDLAIARYNLDIAGTDMMLAK